MAVNLTARLVEQLKAKNGRREVWDAGVPGLGLRIAENGAKTWTLRYRMGHRLRRMTLGPYTPGRGGGEVLSLAAARERARDALRDVADGTDPGLVKQERREAETVGEFAETYINEYAKPQKRSWKIDQMRLNIDVLPHWRHRLMRDIARRDVRELLEGIAQRPAPIVANRVRALLHKFFRFAIERDVVDVNPVAATARPGVEHQRDRVLTDDEIRVFWTATENLSVEMRAFWRLRLITAQRGGEVQNLRWADLDLENAVWTIPGEHAKNKLPHRVTLSEPALVILRERRAAFDAYVAKDAKRKAPVFVLAGARGKRQQAEAVRTFAIENFAGHDLRRTAASCMTSAGISRLVVSKVLNHVERGVTAVYDRHSYDPEKKIALDTWARKLEGILTAKEPAAVLPFARA